MSEISVHVLVATSADGEHHHVGGLEGQLAEGSNSVCALNGGDDALGARELITGIDCLVVVDGEHLFASLPGEIGMHGTNARVVETGRDGKRLLDLTVVGLHHQCACTVDDALRATVHGGSGVVGVDAVTACFGEHNLHAVVVDIVIDGTGGVAATTYAGDEIVGIVASCLLFELPLDLFADHALHLRHDVGVGVRAHRGTNEVEGILGMAAPVADRFRAGVGECHVSGGHRMHLCAEHLHALHVGMLSLHVGLTHEDLAVHAEECADRGCCHAVLTGAGLSDDAGLTHLTGEEYLSDGVVDLVCSRVVEVLTLEIEPAAIALTHALGVVEW